MGNGQPHLSITPNPALVDQAVHIRLTGFAPDQRITLQAHMQDDGNQTWHSYALFKADPQGGIDVSTQLPLAGTYAEIDAMGLFWSMRPADEGQAQASFIKRTLTPVTMHFTAAVEGQVVAAVRLARWFVAPAVTRTPVREQGLVATLFQPEGSGPWPGVIVLGGSDGGLSSAESRAALLASHGYAALALAYFAIEPLPAELVNIPLEYFETAIHWLQRQATIRGDRLAVLGGSKGGELALLLGATYPQIGAVVAYVPSGVIFNGIGRGKEDAGQAFSSWSWQGEPLPFVSRAPLRTLQSQIEGDEPIALLPLYRAGLQDAVAVQQATIPVEKIQGAILLISGGDDQFWPSAQLAELVMERLRQHQHPYPAIHLTYERAGHSIGIPHLPTTVNQLRHPIRGFLVLNGGNARENALARADAWVRALEFLAQNLGRSA